MTIGERIREVRKELSIMQEDFSKKIGTARNTIASYEINRREPMEATIKSICREFNVNYDWLKDGTGEMFCAVPEQQQGCGQRDRSWQLRKDEFVENLLDFVARASKEGAAAEEVRALPTVSDILARILYFN